jgi:hypothetical protein
MVPDRLCWHSPCNAGGPWGTAIQTLNSASRGYPPSTVRGVPRRPYSIRPSQKITEPSRPLPSAKANGSLSTSARSSKRFSSVGFWLTDFCDYPAPTAKKKKSSPSPVRSADSVVHAVEGEWPRALLTWSMKSFQKSASVNGCLVSPCR